ncbi:MAG: hypothetical protein ACI86X_002082, partial [Moritella sp.]
MTVLNQVVPHWIGASVLSFSDLMGNPGLECIRLSTRSYGIRLA